MRWPCRNRKISTFTRRVRSARLRQIGERRVEHLQMIQEVLNRLADYSSRSKGWAVILAAVTGSPTSLGFYGPVLFAVIVLAVILPTS
jgi:hypothetical protein